MDGNLSEYTNRYSYTLAINFYEGAVLQCIFMLYIDYFAASSCEVTFKSDGQVRPACAFIIVHINNVRVN